MRRLLCLALTVIGLSSCGGTGTVRVALSSGDAAATEGVRSLTFVVTAEGFLPQVFGPLPRSQPQARLQTDVPFDVRFFIDVFGCPDTGRCDGELAIARGCSGVEVIAATDPERTFPVELIAEADSECPPAFL